MKRLTTLLLSAALIVGAVSSSYAIDFKAKGYWSKADSTCKCNTLKVE